MNLKNLRKLAEAASEGPWLIVEEYEDPYAEEKKVRRINSCRDTSHEASICEVGEWNHDGAADAAFIAGTSPEVVLELINEITRLRKLRQR
jgi:hypothetical protein